MLLGDEKDRQEREMQRLQEDLLKLSLSSLRMFGGNDQFAMSFAKAHRKLSLALQAQGFTEEQALMIVVHQRLGGMQVRQA